MAAAWFCNIWITIKVKNVRHLRVVYLWKILHVRGRWKILPRQTIKQRTSEKEKWLGHVYRMTNDLQAKTLLD